MSDIHHGTGSGNSGSSSSDAAVIEEQSVHLRPAAETSRPDTAAESQASAEDAQRTHSLALEPTGGTTLQPPPPLSPTSVDGGTSSANNDSAEPSPRRRRRDTRRANDASGYEFINGLDGQRHPPRSRRSHRRDHPPLVVPDVSAALASTDLANIEATPNVDGLIVDRVVNNSMLEVHMQFLHYVFHSLRHPDERKEQLYFCRAENRYVKFLFMLERLRTSNEEQMILSGRVVPPMDVMLFWYLHLTNIRHYVEDMTRLFDETLLHITLPMNRAVELYKVGPSYVDRESAILWESFTGEPYQLSFDDESPFFLNCPVCLTSLQLSCWEYVQLKSDPSFAGIPCTNCATVLTAGYLSAVRFVNDFRGSLREENTFVAYVLVFRGTLLNHITGKPNHYLARQIVQYLTQAPSITDLFTAPNTAHPWRQIQSTLWRLEVDLYALELEDHRVISWHIRVAVDRMEKAYRNLVTPLSLDLVSRVGRWRTHTAMLLSWFGQRQPSWVQPDRADGTQTPTAGAGGSGTGSVLDPSDVLSHIDEKGFKIKRVNAADNSASSSPTTTKNAAKAQRRRSKSFISSLLSDSPSLPRRFRSATTESPTPSGPSTLRESRQVDDIEEDEDGDDDDDVPLGMAQSSRGQLEVPPKPSRKRTPSLPASLYRRARRSLSFAHSTSDVATLPSLTAVESAPALPQINRLAPTARGMSVSISQPELATTTTTTTSPDVSQDDDNDLAHTSVPDSSLITPPASADAWYLVPPPLEELELLEHPHALLDIPPLVIDPQLLVTATVRYHKFLLLQQHHNHLYSDRLALGIDILLCYLTHQLFPLRYITFCGAHFCRLITYEFNSRKDLHFALTKTKALWQKRYHEPYDAGYRPRLKATEKLGVMLEGALSKLLNLSL
ncbi:hypothetical protein RI367_006783 [Sorochytrium milnesiophthora]